MPETIFVIKDKCRCLLLKQVASLPAVLYTLDQCFLTFSNPSTPFVRSRQSGTPKLKLTLLSLLSVFIDVMHIQILSNVITMEIAISIIM